MNEFKYFTCACFTPDHTMRVAKNDWGDHQEVDFEIFIEQRSFWSRLKACFNYLFFKKVNNELTTCVCTMSVEKAQELAKYLTEDLPENTLEKATEDWKSTILATQNDSEKSPDL